jgi:predicted Zn finger-like uncharacterized protein
MILTCPRCTTRYLIDPAKLGIDGRAVRCGKCAHTWHQDPPRDMPRQVEPIPLAIEPRPIPPGSNLPAFPPRRKPRGAGLGWAVLVLVAAAVLGGGLLARERIVQLWPPAAKLYSTLGVMPAPLAAGLKVRNVATKRTLEGGVQVLTVSGEVVNESKEVREVPTLQAVLSDARARAVQRWTFKTAEPKLLPGETAKFSTTLRNPSSEATDISIDFAPAGTG